MLVQVGTTCHPDGWAARPATFAAANTEASGFRILETGGKTWQIEKTDGRVTLKNRALKRARALDANLMPARNLELTTAEAGLSLRLPADALYVLLD